MTCFADIEPLEADWLWPGRIPAGEVTLLAGDSGIGKGFLMADLAARITRGDVMPGGQAGPLAGSVVMVSPEDDPNASTVQRLMAARADLRRVHDLTETGGSLFTVPAGVPSLRAAVDAIGDVRLVIIDPLSAVTEVSLSSNVTCRQNVMRPLQALAKDTGVAVLLVHHTVKSGAIGASKGLVDAARSVLTVTRDKGNADVRVLAVAKSNLAADDVADVAYRVTGEWPSTAVAYVQDGGQGRQPGSGQAAILALLGARGTALCGQEIALATGIGYATARVLLHKMTRKGTITNPARSMYALPLTTAGQGAAAV